MVAFFRSLRFFLNCFHFVAIAANGVYSGRYSLSYLVFLLVCDVVLKCACHPCLFKRNFLQQLRNLSFSEARISNLYSGPTNVQEVDEIDQGACPLANRE